MKIQMDRMAIFPQVRHLFEKEYKSYETFIDWVLSKARKSWEELVISECFAALLYYMLRLLIPPIAKLALNASGSGVILETSKQKLAASISLPVEDVEAEKAIYCSVIDSLLCVEVI